MPPPERSLIADSPETSSNEKYVTGAGTAPIAADSIVAETRLILRYLMFMDFSLFDFDFIIKMIAA